MRLFAFNALKSKNLFSLIVLFAMTITFASAQDAEKKVTATSAYNEALALLKEKKYDEGLPLMAQAVELAEAEENEKVLKLAKKNASKASYSVGKVKYKAGAYDEALKIYNEGIAYDSTNASNVAGIAAVYKKQGNKIEATNYFVQSALMFQEKGKDKNVDKTLKTLNVMTGKAYTGDKFDEAIAIGNKALTIKDHASIAYYVSRAYLEKGENDKALELATKAVDTATKNETMEDKFYIAQAKAYAATGMKTEAIAAYEKVTEEKYLEQAKYQIGQLKG